MSDPIEQTRRAVEGLCKQWLLPGAAHEMEADAAAHALAVLEEARAIYDLNGFGPCDPGCKHSDCGNVRRGLDALRERLTAAPGR